MTLVEVLKIIVLGIVEGFTEWLPISSTGHMILVDEIIKLNQPDAFKDVFLVVIQLGAILAVVVMYFHKLNPFSPSKSSRQKVRPGPCGLRLSLPASRQLSWDFCWMTGWKPISLMRMWCLLP